MERYENLGLVGEGSYGMVLKCRHKESSQIVAIKKFIESEDDQMVKKIAMREIRMLKMLRHENLVNLLEVFRRKKRVYLVFEFVDKTVLDDLERQPDGLDFPSVKRISFQVLRGLEFCHSHNVIHRDVKPENILVSNSGIVKLCDFGFARTLVTGPGEVFTDYVATRWYRSPELLVGDLSYGKAVDIWAVGCLLFEMLTGDPLFPGDSDIDQLFHVTKRLGNLTQRHQEIFQQNPLFIGMRLPQAKNLEPFWTKFPQLNAITIDLIQKSLNLDASKRPSCLDMMKHQLYQEGNFAQEFLETLRSVIQKVTVANPLLKSLAAQKDRNLAHHNMENKEKTKEKKKRENKDHIKKNVSELKRKKEAKHVQKQTSHPSFHHPNVSPNIYDTKQTDSHDTYSKKHNYNTTSKKSNSDIDARHNKKSSNSDCISEVDNEVSLKETFRVKESKSSREFETLHKFSGENERSDTKLSLRTPLEVSINMPGKNLPELNCGVNGNRGHAYESKKHKNVFNKKLLSSHESSTICLLSEKVNLHMEKSKTDDAISIDTLKKDHGREYSEIELPKVPGLILPSVKGADARTTRGSPGKDTPRKPYVTTIPHIQNIDPFSSGSSNNFRDASKELNDSFDRSLRSGNLPAV